MMMEEITLTYPQAGGIGTRATTVPGATPIMLGWVSRPMSTIQANAAAAAATVVGTRAWMAISLAASALPPLKPKREPAPTQILLGWLPGQLSTIQANAAAAAATVVVTRACMAISLAASALPPLKPNQPNHRKIAPSKVNRTLLGSMLTLPNPL